MSDLSSVSTNNSLKELLEDLNGFEAPLDPVVTTELDALFAEGTTGLGYSQFNELQLSFGYNRVNQPFFQYLVNNTIIYKPGTAFKSLEDLIKGLDRFRTHALLLFGSIRHAFERLSNDLDELDYWMTVLEPYEKVEYTERHEAIHPIVPIAGNDTYYLGHLVQDAISDRLKVNPNDQDAINENMRCEKITEVGIRNYNSYLASDHLDVYIATSMREKEEYFLINRWVKEIFGNIKLKELKLRWFDPTQAFCANRVDKGIFEGLMLKRAKCTLYFVQETDTIGKDLELASTLAQGKTVIAFVPRGDKEYVDNLLQNIKALYPEKDDSKIMLDLLRVFKPNLAWEDKLVQQWVSEPSTFVYEKAKEKLYNTVSERYDERASTLSERHPLGIQVNLQTGVANGVLVVRDLKSCVELIYRVITKTLQFSIVEVLDNQQKYLYLKEKVSGCIYRIATGDQRLTNTFWNFYTYSSE